MVMLLTEMSLRETDCCALKHIKKTFNKTFKELQNEYLHDHLWSAEQGPIFLKFVCFGPRHGERKIGSWSTRRLCGGRLWQGAKPSGDLL